MLIDECTPNQIPVGIDDEQQPHTYHVAYEAHPSKVRHMSNSQETEWDEEEKEKGVAPVPSSLHQEDIHNGVDGNRHQFIRLYLLSRCFLHTEPNKEFENQYEEDTLIEHVACLDSSFLKSITKHHTKEDEVTCHEGNHAISEYFHETIAFKHRMTFLAQFLVL